MDTNINPSWISDELLAETQRVWSSVYGREVAVAEATEILLNVKRLAGLLVRPSNAAAAGKDSEEKSRSTLAGGKGLDTLNAEAPISGASADLDVASDENAG